MSGTIYRCYEPDCPEWGDLEFWKNFYESEIDHAEYQDFGIWFMDMIKSGNLVMEE